MQAGTVLVFVKYPTPGRVKTRLARTLGDDEAAAIYRRLVSRVLEILARSRIGEVRVMFDPPDAESEARVREWLAPNLQALACPVSFHAQHPGDLGERLEQGFRQAFDDGAKAVAAIGTDCVGITAATLAQTWEALAASDAVFGPTEDGGYYLVATRAHRPEFFDSIPWSSEDTLARSLQQAQEHGCTVELLAPLWDIDTEADWLRAREDYFPEP